MYPVYPYYSYREVCEEVPVTFPPQHQDRQPGLEYLMVPPPIFEYEGYKGSGKLKGKVAIITGGDSGIGRAISIAFAKEGADIVIVYLDEHRDARFTQKRVEELGAKCLLIATDLGRESASYEVVNETIKVFGHIDILINNHAYQKAQPSVLDITAEQLETTFRVNVFAYIYMTKAVLPYLCEGSNIINTASTAAYRGNVNLIEYSASKGAIVSYTRSLALSLVDQGIRVNAVSPGPVWTPLTTSSYDAERVSEFGLSTPMGRAGQPFELAPAYVYLASDDSRYVTGQVMQVNGGVMVGS